MSEDAAKPNPPRSATTCIVGAATVDADSFDALLTVMRKPVARESGPIKPKVGPRGTAALHLLGASMGTIRHAPIVDAGTTLARDGNYNTAPHEQRPRIAGVGAETDVPPLMLPIPADHDANQRDDEHADFAELHAQGLIRDRAGEVIETRSIWHAWGAWRMDRFFQAYCRVAKDAVARGENFPSDSVRDWVENEARRQGMSLDFALRVIRDGCGGDAGRNARWWRGASLPPA